VVLAVAVGAEDSTLGDLVEDALFAIVLDRADREFLGGGIEVVEVEAGIVGLATLLTTQRVFDFLKPLCFGSASCLLSRHHSFLALLIGSLLSRFPTVVALRHT